MVNDTFHPFLRLPIEIRIEIWRFCLPHRVCEMDDPIGWIVYDADEWDATLPCYFCSTSVNNGRAPLLTRVCRESRAVAFESGNWAELIYPYRGPDAVNDGAIERGYWADPLRDSAHLNWTVGYRADFGCPINGQPMLALGQEAKDRNGSASLMLDYLISTSFRDYSKQEDLAVLMLLPEWLVVMRVIVIHLDFAQAARTGLFGLLGDAYVQVVDAASPLASQLWELAETCERQAYAIKAAQDFTRMSSNDMNIEVKRKTFDRYHDHRLSKRVRPAIMFRLCTKMCNHSDTLGEEPKVWTA